MTSQVHGVDGPRNVQASDDQAPIALSRSVRRWRPGVTERLGFYVYLLIDPRTGIPFYVGKGAGDRCFSHVVEAHRTARDSRGEYTKLGTIREIENAGVQVQIDLLRHGLDDATAFVVESASIDLLGMHQLTNRVVGHATSTLGRMTVDDVDALYGAVPAVFDADHRVMLIRVAREFQAGINGRDLYEATRTWWRVQERRRQLGSPSAPAWAMAVYRGVIRAVYRIDGWEPAPAVDDNPKQAGRWGFWGARDPMMEERYLFADVTARLPQGAQNSIRYINCA